MVSHPITCLGWSSACIYGTRLFDRYLDDILASNDSSMISELRSMKDSLLSSAAVAVGPKMLVHVRNRMEKVFPEERINWQRIYLRVASTITRIRKEATNNYTKIHRDACETLYTVSKSLLWLGPLATSHFNQDRIINPDAKPHGYPGNGKPFGQEHFLYGSQHESNTQVSSLFHNAAMIGLQMFGDADEDDDEEENDDEGVAAWTDREKK